MLMRVGNEDCDIFTARMGGVGSYEGVVDQAECRPCKGGPWYAWGLCQSVLRSSAYSVFKAVAWAKP